MTIEQIIEKIKKQIKNEFFDLTKNNPDKINLLENILSDLESAQQTQNKLIEALEDIIGCCWGLGGDEQEEALTKGKQIIIKNKGR